jgi:small subunit ribosomal protein S20
MANHKSSKKRTRQDSRKRLANRYVKKTTRTAIQRLREIEDKKDAETFLPKVIKLIDGLVKRNIWHKNKGANLKSSLTKHVNSLSEA